MSEPQYETSGRWKGYQVMPSDQPVVPDVMVRAASSVNGGLFDSSMRALLQAALTALRDTYGPDAYLHVGSGEVVRQVHELDSAVLSFDPKTLTWNHVLIPIEGENDDPR